MSVLRALINALWRRYSWFESMRGSQIDLDAKLDGAALEAAWHRLPTGKVINLISPSDAFIAILLAAFDRLDPFDPRLMYL